MTSGTSGGSPPPAALPPQPPNELADRTRPGWGWWTYAVVGVLAIPAFALLPDAGKLALYMIFDLSAAVALAVAARRSAGMARLAWALLALGPTCYTAGDLSWGLTFALTGSVTTPSYIDALYLANYPLSALGLLIFARLRQASRGWDALIDVLIAGVAGALAIWMLLLPLFTASKGSVGENVVFAAYPVGDLILIVLITRLAIVSGGRVRSLWLLLTGFVIVILADLVYAILNVRTAYTAGGYVDVIWLFGMIAITLAALHPSARDIGRPDPSTERSLLYRRIAFISVAGLVPPILFAINAATGQLPKLAIFATGSAALYLLILTRLFVVVRQGDEELRRARLPWFLDDQNR